MRTTAARIVLLCIGLMVIGLFLPYSSYARINPETVIGIWLFDEGEDDVAKDSSGNGHEGQIAGNVKWVDGRFGGGLEFPGAAGNFVNVPHDDALNLTAFTITYWCRMGETATWQIPVAKVSGANRNVDFQTPAGGGTVSIYFTQGASQWKGADAKTEITDEKWHHVAGTYDLENLRIYVDGVMEGEGKFKGPPDHVDGPLTFGDMQGAHPVGGIVDEIGIFNKSLSVDDIESIMTKGLERALGITAVLPADKLAATWASIKKQ